MTTGRHRTSKKPTDSTFNATWSGVSNAPHCKKAVLARTAESVYTQKQGCIIAPSVMTT
jgi:hypothetical protein